VSKTILLCTLGASWAVIPEIYGFLAPGKLPLFANHPDNERLERLRRQYDLKPPDEIWVVTTEGATTMKSLERLFSWWERLDAFISLRVWQATATNELAGEEECEWMRELTLRACLHAVEQTGESGQLLLSLAGGRKTMSADLQWAGSIFGCHALLHVVDSGALPDQLRFAEPAFLTVPLPAEIDGKPCAGVVTPLVVGRGYHSDFLDVAWNDHGPVTAGRFPLPGMESLPCGGHIRRSWKLDTSGASLVEEIAAREKEGQQLLGNYLAEVSRDEHHENWRSLYRLPPRIIDRLRQTIVVEELKPVLDEIPKAEIHCHLGGILGIASQVRVGQAVWESLTPVEKKSALKRVSDLLKNTDEWPWDWPENLHHGDRSANTAALLVNLPPEIMEKHLYGDTQPRFALVEKHAHGFAAYERPGELTGSSILGRPEGIRQYAKEVYQQICRQNLLYCELRGSPVKYLAGDGMEFLRQFYAAIETVAGEREKDAALQPIIKFVVICDRRDADAHAGDMDLIRKSVDLVLKVREDPQLKDFVVGLDLAGDELAGKLDTLKELYAPAFAECLPITIHAGETQPADNIWNAAYRLHADRIGHGLSLVENQALAAHFRDRNICLELCPTSNMEVVGFIDTENKMSEDGNFSPYPLKELWDLGLPLTICTDNPGISRTTLTAEYLKASSLTPGGLSFWDALAMMKQAFSHAFLPAGEREKLIKQADKIIYRQMLDRFTVDK